MPIVKLNIWALFKSVLIGAVITLLFILFYRWESIKNDAFSYHEYRAKISAQNLDVLLGSQEVLLKIIGLELLSERYLEQQEEKRYLMDRLLDSNHVLIAMGLACNDGQLVAVSSNLHSDNYPNLMQNPETKETFERALHSQYLVIGRTYFVKSLQQWVIPIRKAIRDSNGQAIAVMTAGFAINNESFLNENFRHDGKYDSITIYNDSNGRIKFMSQYGVPIEVYSQFIGHEDFRRSRKNKVEKVYSRSLDELKQSEQSIKFLDKRPFILTDSSHQYGYFLTVAVYNKRYNLWVVSDTAVTPLINQFLFSLVIYTVILAVLTVAFYKWCQIINKSQKEKTRALIYQNRHDELTHLLNRNGLLREMGKYIVKSEPGYLVMVNIVNFKSINNRFCMEIGDKCLVGFAKRLKELVEQLPVARISGDEFAFVLTEPDEELAQSFCQRLCERLEHNFLIEEQRLLLTVNMGLTRFPTCGTNFDELTRRARIAGYKARSFGKHVFVYRADIEENYLRTLRIEERLRLALQQGGLSMAYQCKFDRNRKVIGMEALLRWKDSELGWVSPHEFVEVAEHFGLIYALGDYAIKQSVKDFSSLMDVNRQNLSLAINISALQIKDPAFSENLLVTL